MSIFLALAMLSVTQPIADQMNIPEEEGQIRVLPVSRTPESNTVMVRVSSPKRGAVLKKNPLWIQFRVDGYALGAGSTQFERSSEIYVSPMGQTMHVIIDDEPYVPVNEPAIDPFNEEGFYYDKSYKVEWPHSLKEGIHTLRMFPARSFGESLKGENSFVATYFYLGDEAEGTPPDLNKPYLTYNEPSDLPTYKVGYPVLLDFYIRNCELTADGYKVKLTIDGKTKRTLTSWQPYYIYGLKKGKHTIRLQLIERGGKEVPGPFNDVQRTIQVR